MQRIKFCEIILDLFFHKKSLKTLLCSLISKIFDCAILYNKKISFTDWREFKLVLFHSCNLDLHVDFWFLIFEVEVDVDVRQHRGLKKNVRAVRNYVRSINNTYSFCITHDKKLFSTIFGVNLRWVLFPPFRACYETWKPSYEGKTITDTVKVIVLFMLAKGNNDVYLFASYCSLNMILYLLYKNVFNVQYSKCVIVSMRMYTGSVSDGMLYHTTA